MSLSQQEKEKYEKAWSHSDYRNYSPGENIAVRYVLDIEPEKKRIIDFGTGTGRGALVLHKLGFDVTMIDIADNCLDKEVEERIGNRLVIGNLWDKLDLPKAEEGFCTDVMEHIPPEKVDYVIKNILSMTYRSFFHICLREDHFGQVLDEHLHLTVRPFTWWRDKLMEHGEVLDARDLINNGWFYVR
jgi:hypothetical protein